MDVANGYTYIIYIYISFENWYIYIQCSVMHPRLPSAGSPMCTIDSIWKVQEGANYESEITKIKQQVSGAGDSKGPLFRRFNCTVVVKHGVMYVCNSEFAEPDIPGNP